MRSNNSLDIYRQLVDCLECLRIALEMRDFEALAPLVQDQAHLMTLLQQMGDQMESLDAEVLAQAHNEVVELLVEARQQQAELGRDISNIGNKSRHINIYRRNQF